MIGHGRLAVLTRAGWSLTDQALSSLTNFVLFFLLARTVTAADLGAITVAFSTYLLAVGVSRALCSEPVVVRFSAVPEAVLRRAAGGASGFALLLGLGVGVLAGTVGALLRGLAGEALLALAVCLPGLLVQDSWRFYFFALGRPARAAANDGLWAVLQLSAIAWLVFAGDPSVPVLILAWGGAGTVSGLVGIAQAGLLPAPRKAAAWLRDHGDLAMPFAGEFGVTTGANEASAYTVPVAADLAALGALRAAHVMVGPVSILLMGAAVVGTPEGVRLWERAPGKLWRVTVSLSGLLALAAACWGILILLIPVPVGTAILGENWIVGRSVMVPVTLAFVAHGVSVGPGVGLRVLGLARRSLRARSVVAPAALAGATVGALLGGAYGAAVGLAAAQMLGTFVWWRHYLTGYRERMAAIAEQQ